MQLEPGLWTKGAPLGSDGRWAGRWCAAACLAGALLACGNDPETTPTGSGGSTTSTGAGGATGGSGGTGTGGAAITPIADIKQNDAQGVPLLMGQTVTIRGIVTVPSDVFSIENHEIYVQDATGGLSVYEEGKQSVEAALGDDLRITGVVGQFSGKTEVDDPTYELLGTGQPQPTPAETTTGQLCTAGEPLDGDLVVLRGLTIIGGETWPTVAQSGNANVDVDDGSGPCLLRIDHHTELNGSPEPAQPFDAVGVIKQYDAAPPYDSGYTLQPRFVADIAPTSR